MDEQVIDDLYNRAVSKGYKKSRQEFIGLLHSDGDVMNDMYSYVQSKGYKKGVDDFKNLVGATAQSPSIEQPTTQIPFVEEVKKKEDTTALPSGLGSSVSSVSAEPEMAKFGYQPGKPLPEQIPSVQPDQPVQPKYTQEVMFGPMGISGVKTTGRAQEFQGKSIPNVVGELGKTFGKGVVKFPADILETAAIAAAAAKNVAAKTGIVDETSAFNVSLPFGGVNVNFFQAAGEWKDLVDGFVPTDKDIESGFWGQTANALGQMVPILLTGGLSGGARAIAKEAGKKGLSMQAVANYGKNVVSRIGTPQGAITISQVAAPSYEQAKLEGATENEALGYAIQNAVMTFPLEMLPVNNLFKRLDNVLVGNTGVEVLKRAVVGGGEELITEGVQAVYENVTADAIYGTTRGFLDGVGEAAAVGGTVGAIMNGVLTALLGRRARATSDKEIEEIDKSIKDVEQKIAQVESNNESINETVKVLEETKLRKLSYGSADYNFIESPEGALEYADDALTEQQAQGIVGNLANSYKKIDFTIEEVEPEDPYQPTTYKIIGKPKPTQQAVVESGLTPEQRRQQIESIELELKLDDRMLREGRPAFRADTRYDLEQELQTLKAEEDAFQEQAAGQVPVQSGATVSQEVAQGEPQTEPQGVAQEVTQEEVGSGLFDLKEIGKNIKQDDLIRFQELSESLREGELLLKDNVDVSGKKLTPEKRLQIEKSVESTKQKIQSLSPREVQIQEVVPIIESAKNSLGKRLSGDQLLNSQDLIDELNDNKAEIDEDGMVTVYHRTTPENKAEIERTGEMQGLEDGVFFSTTETGQNQGYGNAVVKLKVPVEQLIVDDTFGDEAHLRIPTSKAGQVIKVKEYIQPEAKTTAGFADELSAKYGVELELQDNKTDNSISVPKIVVPKDQRNTGVGTKVMKEVVEFADKSGKKLVLTPSTSFGGTSVKRLVDFYKGLGFVENKGRNKDFTIRDSMYRSPVPVIQETAPVSPKPAPVAKAPAKKSAAQAKREEIISRPAFTPITLARQWLLSGGKLLPKQSEENKRRGVGAGKGVQEETGMSGVEMRALGDVTDSKKGISIEMAAERIYEGLNEELQASMEGQDIRNAMIEILSSENRKSWIENQDRDTSEENQNSAREEFEYAQLTEQERADFDAYQQEQSYANYLGQNAKRLAKEYDAYIKSKTYQDYIEETYERDREGQNNAQNQNDGRGKKQGSDVGAAPVQGKSAKAPEVDTVINEETGTLESALDFLDGVDKTIAKTLKTRANDALLGIPLTAIQGMVKGLKALVQGGMKLRDAIKRIAEENNITQDKLKELLDLGAIAVEFNEVMDRADKLIAAQNSKNIDEKTILTKLETKLRKEPAYINGTDAQRKIMEREVRAKMGAQPRKAASIGRVLGALKDITNVSRKEKLQIIARIRELSRDVAKDLSAEIKSLAKEGKITAIQSANIITRFGKVNLLNESSVSSFVDYMAKVFADAEYDSKIAKANSKVSRARRNIATKIGVSDGLMLPLKKLFAVNPNLIPDNSLERYLELLDMFSENAAVLTLENKSTVKKDVDAILKDIDTEQSKVDELADAFNNSKNQAFNDEGNLDYAATLKNMVKADEITDEDAELMRKYKQDIIPQVESTKLSDEEIAKKKKEAIAVLQKQTVSAEVLPSQNERNLANRLAKLIKETSEENLMKLSLTDLKNLLKVTGNINNNYLPHYAQVMVEKLNAINNGKVVANAVKTAKPLSFSVLYAKLKAVIIKSQKGGISELVRRNPLFYIDQVFGDFKTKDVFNALFEKAAEGEANFKAELKKVQNILENAETKVAKSFNLNPDKTLMSKFKMMTYMIQLEHDSNVGSEQVNPAAAYLKETIKHIDGGKSRFGERDANMLQDILDKYTKNGQIDIDKLYNSFNQAEKDAIKDVRGINESLKDTAQYTAAIIRGDAIDPLNNYVHLNVLHDTEPLDVSAATDFLNQANNSRKPSTKAKSLIERTKGAKPLNFDLFASAQRGAKFVLLDYNLTEPIRTARRTINQATANIQEAADKKARDEAKKRGVTDENELSKITGRIPKEQRDINNAIDGAFEEAASNLLTNSILQNTFADEVIDFISKQGYRSVLAGTGRFAAELTSNISFALLADPKGFNAGIKYRDIIMSTDAPLILKNVNSKQTNRIFPSDTLSGRLIDTSILNQAAGIQGRSSKNPVLNKMQQIYNLTIKKPKNVIELVADSLIATPDKLVIRPLWFGAFANEFKSIKGKDVDFKKIAENDQAYMDANKDAIEQSKKLADERSVMTGATDNAFMGILKGTLKPNQSGYAKAFNNFNNYMSRFLIFEYMTARTAVYALVGNGSLSKKQGAAMLGAVFTRMTVYTVLSQMLASGIMGLIGFGDEEEEDEKSLMQKIGQSLTGTFSSLLFGRDFGNATKLAINYGLEEVNEKYLDFLRNGEYDPYKDGIAYSLIPRDDRPNDNLANLLMSMSGALGPAYNTANLIYENRNRIITGETTKKELDAIEREDRTVKERIPLEVLGHLGFIPFYKDIRKEVNKSIYSSIKEAERAAVRTKRRDAELLGGYDNKEDLKRYDRALYEKNFGEGSEWYESTKEERAEKEKEAKDKQIMKDRLNNYTPKDEDGFGSSGFGGSSKKKSKDGFGSKGFGND